MKLFSLSCLESTIAAILVFIAHVSSAAEPSDVRDSLVKGVRFYTEEVAVYGTYLWAYSEDLSKREGEGVATSSEGWLQPPGTPSVGMALLEAYEATGDEMILNAARATGRGLIQAQLRSGGWYYYIDFTEEGERRKLAYRHLPEDPERRDISTLDDDVTQSVLRFLVRLDRALNFDDRDVRESIDHAFESVFSAQHENGGWPQGYHEEWKSRKSASSAATYPESWSREWPGSQGYWFSYTLNDNVLANMVDTFLEAAEIYRSADTPSLERLSEDCDAAARMAGEFLILAQMPEPQPAWAQQYDMEMRPRWARRFEPPAISGLESQGAMRTLLKLHEWSGDARFIEPVGRALEYLKRSALPDGRLARFYELKTNRPLYFTTDYVLTYDDSDVPTHYGFKVGNGLGAIEADYRKRLDGGSGSEGGGARLRPVADAEVHSIIEAQDDRGRWVETGRLRYHTDEPAQRVIRSRTFVRNVETLSRYLRQVEDAER